MRWHGQRAMPPPTANATFIGVLCCGQKALLKTLPTANARRRGFGSARASILLPTPISSSMEPATCNLGLCAAPAAPAFPLLPAFGLVLVWLFGWGFPHFSGWFVGFLLVVFCRSCLVFSVLCGILVGVSVLPRRFWLMFSPSQFSSFGFGGSRSGQPVCLAACSAFLSSVPPGAAVFVSCGSGAPALVRAAFPSASIFRASQFSGLGSAAFAARAAAMVRALAASPSPLFVCFPGCPCPASLLPARSWRGSGSGSWSECSLAFGLRVSVLVFLPAGVFPPSSWGSWQSLGSGWFFLPLSQPSLF